jgi:exodeoxyribonuclease VII small subunit
MADPVRPEQVTFEQGYEQLKTIVSELDRPDVSVHDMFEGFRRGKGLEKALRQYLEEHEGELTEIADGKNVPEFVIVAPSGAPAQNGAGAADRGTSGAKDGGIRVARGAAGDEEIPF